MMPQEANSNSALARLQGAGTQVRERWTAMSDGQRRLLVLGALGLVALLSLSAWWGSRTDWRTLFSGLESRDAAQVQQQLSSAGITYQTTPDGTAVQVPAEQLDKARVAIAAKGMPQSGRLGFELFDKPNWVGSEFDEKVNYQRALEGELEHTIESLDAVRTARVHVVLARQGAFSTEDQPAKASVMLKLRRAQLPLEQADSIRALVAGAVEGLQTSAVNLMDADGRVNFAPKSARGAEHEEEAALEQKVVALLEPLAGPGNVRATVSISYIEGTEEHTDEIYDPSQAVPVQTEHSERSAQTTKASGVAGTAGNTPAAVAVNNTPATPDQARQQIKTDNSLSPSPNTQAQNTKDESTSYAVTRHLTHTAEGAGRVRRVATAVIVNDRRTVVHNGSKLSTVWKPRSVDEVKRMQQLAEAAVGLDTKRGDEVVLQNIGFTSNDDGTPPALLDRVGSETRDLLRSQPSLLRTVATGICLLVLGTMVLRPLSAQTAKLLQPVAAPRLLEDGSELLSKTQQPVETPQLTGAPEEAQSVFQRVTTQIKGEPQASARLLEAWINSEEHA